MALTLGKRRALQQCAGPDGTFRMLAMDQRGSLIRMIDDSRPEGVTFGQVAAAKRDVIRILSPHASAVLLDAEYGYPACVASGALRGEAGLLLALEKSGYEGDPTARRTALLEDWSVEKIRRTGASGVKLLLFYRPDAPNAADQEQLVMEVAAECATWDLPLFVEPLHYPLQAGVKSVPNPERRRLVIETARRITSLGIDVLKAEFPVDVSQTEDEAEWADACAELSSVSPIPWVLLSAGVEYDTFLRQLKVACESGASGMLCGRAIWKESIALAADERAVFLSTTGVERIQRLDALIRALARPFTDFYPATGGDEYENWYQASG